MEANIEDPLTSDEIAGLVGVSRRQLERLFRKQLGHSPAHYYLELRLERAQHLINQSDLPVVLGVTLAAALFIVLANLIVDLLYGVVDPRVRRS